VDVRYRFVLNGLITPKNQQPGCWPADSRSSKDVKAKGQRFIS